MANDTWASCAAVSADGGTLVAWHLSGERAAGGYGRGHTAAARAAAGDRGGGAVGPCRSPTGGLSSGSVLYNSVSMAFQVGSRVYTLAVRIIVVVMQTGP